MMTRLNVFMDYNEKGDQIQQQKKKVFGEKYVQYPLL